jgi:seryl-tRNA synthetase
MTSFRDIIAQQEMDEEENRQKKTIETLVKSVEKLVRLNQEQTKELNELQLKIGKLENKIGKLETEMTINKNNTSMAMFHANADEDLHNYMMEAKDMPSDDLPLTKSELNQKLQKFVERSGVKITE